MAITNVRYLITQLQGRALQANGTANATSLNMTTTTNMTAGACTLTLNATTTREA